MSYFDPDLTQPHGRPEPTLPHGPARPPLEPLPYDPPPPLLLPPPGRRRRRRRRRIGCAGCLLRSILAGGLFAGLFTCLIAALYVLAPPPRTNILLLGLDSRPGEGTVTRSDTLILMTVDPEHLYVGMLSIPRDLYVNVPGYGPQRINTAHVLGELEYAGGGLDLAEATVEGNFGVPVHRTIRMNFEAFVAIVDAAGGVTIDVENRIIDYDYPTPDYGTTVIEFQPGEQWMSGERALQYARTRHSGSDFERAERQQQVIAALARQLANPLNWWRLPDVMLAFAQNVESDLNLIDAAMLAPTVLWVGPNGIDRQVITPDMAVGTTLDNGASVLMPQWGRINPVLEYMFER